jgi:hypothetical protein
MRIRLAFEAQYSTFYMLLRSTLQDTEEVLFLKYTAPALLFAVLALTGCSRAPSPLRFRPPAQRPPQKFLRFKRRRPPPALVRRPA